MKKKRNYLYGPLRTDKKELAKIIREQNIHQVVFKYYLASFYVEGAVLDIACGGGHGTFLLGSREKIVKQVVGVDCDLASIDYAKEHFQGQDINFVCALIEEFKYNKGFDWAVSINTIEHLDDPRNMVRMFLRNKVKNIFLSFPGIKTTHIDPGHKHDLEISDIKKIFSPDYSLYRTIMSSVSPILLLKRNR